MQHVPLLDHRDSPALARPLLDLLETDRLKQSGRRRQATETPEKDVLIPTASAEGDRLMQKSPAQSQRPGRWIDQEPAQLSVPLEMADYRDAADEASFPFRDP